MITCTKHTIQCNHLGPYAVRRQGEKRKAWAKSILIKVAVAWRGMKSGR